MDSGDNLWELIYSQKDEPKKEPDADYVAVNEEEEVIDELDNYIDYYEDDDEAGFQSKDHISSERREIIRASNKRNFCGVGVFSSRPFLSRLVKKRLPPFYVQSPEVKKVL